MTELARLMRDFLRDDAGTPLGAGMPSGGPLRADGESHYEAWQSLLRRDPCSYCGAVGASGTVDHVDARSRGARGLGTVHGWVNTVGACGRCNGAKRDLGLLVFLYRRRWTGTTIRPGEPARATRRVVRRWSREATAHVRALRAGSVPLADVVAQLDEQTARLEQLTAESDLPASGDGARVDRFLVQTYREAWG